MEQAVPVEHTCKDIRWYRYQIVYNDNVRNGYRVVFDADEGTVSGMNGMGLLSVSGSIGYTNVTVNPISQWIKTFSDGKMCVSTLTPNGDDAVFKIIVTANGLTHTLQVTYVYSF